MLGGTVIFDRFTYLGGSVKDAVDTGQLDGVRRLAWIALKRYLDKKPPFLRAFEDCAAVTARQRPHRDPDPAGRRVTRPSPDELLRRRDTTLWAENPVTPLRPVPTHGEARRTASAAVSGSPRRSLWKCGRRAGAGVAVSEVGGCCRATAVE